MVVQAKYQAYLYQVTRQLRVSDDFGAHGALEVVPCN